MRNYLAFIEAQIQTLSQSRMTIDAMQEYKAAFSALTRQTKTSGTANEMIEKGNPL